MSNNKKILLGEKTKKSLIETARKLFVHGYESISTPEVAQSSGVTRGALYHHFSNKRDLFEAVVETIAEEISQKIDRSAEKAADPIEAIISGSHEFVEVCLQPDIRKIFLEDAPSILGWKRWREIDARHGLGSLKAGLRACVEAGYIESDQVDSVAHLISGALNEAAFLFAEKDTPNRLKQETLTQIDRMIYALLRST